MEDNQIKFGVECPASVKRALKVAAAERGVALKDAYAEAFSLWSADRLLVESLLTVLRSGNAALIEDARRLMHTTALKSQSVPDVRLTKERGVARK
jgi:hypothetical protein